MFVRKNKFFEVPLASPTGEALSAAELEVCVRVGDAVGVVLMVGLVRLNA